MRRMHLATLVLGLVGVLGFTIVQVGAEPAKTPYGATKSGDPVVMPSDFAIPKLTDKDVNPASDLVLPPLLTGPSLEPVVKPPAAKPDVPILAPMAELPVLPPKLTGPAPEELELKAAPPSPKPAPAKPVVESVSPPPLITAGNTSNKIAPGVTLETIVPEAVPMGHDATYEILVRNAGLTPVTGVKVEDELPSGARYLGGEPMADVSLSTLRWTIGDLAVGGEKKIKVTVKPSGDSDYKTNPKMTFTSTTTNTVRITRPKIVASVKGPESVLINEEAAFVILVKNEGSGPAAKVKIHVALPPGLRHPQQRDGSPVEAELPALAAGETKTVTLKTMAIQPGAQTCELTVMGEACSAVTAKATTMIQKPMLEAKLISAGKAMVRGEPNFTLEVMNPGNAATPGVQAAVSFPEGLEFVSASDSGNYEPGSRTVTWNLGPQAAGAKKLLSFKLRAGVAGKIELRAVAASPLRLDDKPLEARSTAMLQVEGVPAVAFEVVNLDNPAEIGKEVTYEIRVLNQGTCPLTNIRLGAAFSEGLKVTGVTGPTKHTAGAQSITFDPVPRLAVKADLVIRVKAKSAVAGDLRCKVQLSCDQLKLPVAKEESTVFFQP